MKTRLLLPVLLVALSLVPAFSQTQPGQPIPAVPLMPALRQPEKLTTFSLDFPGGTPQQLVAAIEKAMSKPLNVIIAAEHADFQLLPLKMKNVTVGQLFAALALASHKTDYVLQEHLGRASYQVNQTYYGFRTEGPQSDDSIWYFYVEKPNMPPLVASVVPKVCRFYALTSYLERGLTVDDITTAIQTGWKMLGDEETPTISFHKETKLLIAVGDPAKLETIDAVLKALSPTPTPGGMFPGFIPTPAVGVPPPQLSAPKPPEKPKTGN